MQTLNDFFNISHSTHIYNPNEILLNFAVAFTLGMLVSWIYKKTHRGLSYSQSFMLTNIFVAVIVCMVIMVIGNNLARAFALVGALSIIRFRTVVKDTKDTAYIFWALAAGMAAGTGSYFLAIAGSTIISIMAYVLHYTNYGSLNKSEFILQFRADNTNNDLKYISIIQNYAKTSSLLHAEPSGDGSSTKLSYDITMKDEHDQNNLSADLASTQSISEVVLIAAKSDVDY
tara:strand:- start:294 stop:983 length:690 start_codon:yes stop_codon:yes gene_type:complete